MGVEPPSIPVAGTWSAAGANLDTDGATNRDPTAHGPVLPADSSCLICRGCQYCMYVIFDNSNSGS